MDGTVLKSRTVEDRWLIFSVNGGEVKNPKEEEVKLEEGRRGMSTKDSEATANSMTGSISLRHSSPDLWLTKTVGMMSRPSPPIPPRRIPPLEEVAG